MGECDQKTTEEILDFFYESGGNFIDTANNYQVSTTPVTLVTPVFDDQIERRV